MSKEVKIRLFNACNSFVKKRAETVEQILNSNSSALQTETKSSAGDKHETGRAMLQLEMEKASQQLQNIHQMNEVLKKIAFENTTTRLIKLGSVVYTDHRNFYISISAGEIKIDKTMFYAVSQYSPIGKLLLGKKEGERVKFNQKMLIKSIY